VIDEVVRKVNFSIREEGMFFVLFVMAVSMRKLLSPLRD